MVRTLTVLFVFGFSIAAAQLPLDTKSKKAIEYYTEADNYRVRGQYSQAIRLLTEAIEKDRNFTEAYYRLGIVYMTLQEFPRAITYLENGLSLTKDIRKQKVFWYDLGESYFTEGNYDKAEEILKKFLGAELQNKVKIDRARLLLNNVEFARENKKNASAYKLRRLSDTVNAYVMQYFPVLTADQQSLIFTRRLGGGPSDDEDLVISTKNKRGRWEEPMSLSKNINSELNEGTCTISADGRKLIFTSCVGRQGYGSCDLFQSVRIGDEWTQPKNLGPMVNSAEWESQPSLSADGRTLYFVSDRRGGQGRRDIWVSTLNESGQWTRAKNVGKPVNTPYDEISPFIHVNNRVLYFASNGQVGFGGYDIFFSERDSVSAWREPKNIGSPINNHEDQFSLFITADGKKGYYSHEEAKEGGYSASQIYEIEIPEENRIRYASNYVKGVVRDKQTRAPLDASIELINLESNQTESLVSSDSVSGAYLIVLTQGAEYALYVNRPGYLFQSLNFNYSTVKNFEPIVLDIELQKATEGTRAILQNIFFEVDKYDLQPKSVTELEKIQRFLKENPAVRVEISGHTDNSGTAAHNASLSQKRAQSVYDYLISHGVEASRLFAKGYGADQPIADNSTEEGRQKNRRIEFKLIR
jgi:outer membrane protein OmpA-like peptidoglycan-associated protein/tetratricopeptide (TPR) repeat protein